MGAHGKSRLALDEPARLAPNDWSSLEVRLLECTERSFRARCDETVRIAGLVSLVVPGIGPVKAYITWRRRNQFSATFAEPLDLSRARFMPVNGEAVLARLLRERATAYASGRKGDERKLRARISEALPMRPV